MELPNESERNRLIASKYWLPIEHRLKQLVPVAANGQPLSTFERLNLLAARLPTSIFEQAHALRAERNRLSHEMDAHLKDANAFMRSAELVLDHLNRLSIGSVTIPLQSTAEAPQPASAEKSGLSLITQGLVGIGYLVAVAWYLGTVPELFRSVGLFSLAWFGLVLGVLVSLPGIIFFIALAIAFFIGKGLWWVIQWFIANPY